VRWTASAVWVTPIYYVSDSAQAVWGSSVGVGAPAQQLLQIANCNEV